MGRNYNTLSESAIVYLCGLLRNLASVGDGIDDIQIRTDGTFSSYKIDSLISRCIEDGRDYADKICAALVKLTCQKTNVKPTLENSDINVIYLYSSTGSSPFEQWLKISDTELINMGSTSINLDDYYNKEDIDNNFALKSSYEDIVNLLGTETLTTTASSIKGAINEVNDNTVKTKNIKNNIAVTSTDDDIPTAKAVFDFIDNSISSSGSAGIICRW